MKPKLNICFHAANIAPQVQPNINDVASHTLMLGAETLTGNKP